MICDLRTAHRGWGPRRLVFELERRRHPKVSRSAVYRVLVRRHLVGPVSRRRRRDQYRRQERPAAMELWQMDVTASLFLAGGRECKAVTGIDDHSRFCVIAAVVMRATARAVGLAFTGAMAEYGIPGEMLTDNGKQFTGRFGRPRPAEVMFERICRQSSITQRLTKPRSPTTTGKIERLHQTLQPELLTPHGPFAGIEDAQDALGAWREDYNTRRPHQCLGMAFPPAGSPPPPPIAPASGAPPGWPGWHRFPLPKIPAQMKGRRRRPLRPPPQAGRARRAGLDRVVPPSGNLRIAGQQVWPGPAMTGRTVRIWAGLTQVHVPPDGHRSKTLPSRLGVRDLARLAAGAQPAGPPPLPPASGDVTQADRTVNASGNVSPGDHVISVGSPLAGQRVTLRLGGPVVHVLAAGVIVRTVACPVPAEARPRLRGARPRTAQPPRQPEPLVVTRRVPARGAVMAGRQKIQAGLSHARMTVQVTAGPDTYEITVEPGITITAARTSSRDIRRPKAPAYPPSGQGLSSGL